MNLKNNRGRIKLFLERDSTVTHCNQFFCLSDKFSCLSECSEWFQFIPPILWNVPSQVFEPCNLYNFYQFNHLALCLPRHNYHSFIYINSCNLSMFHQSTNILDFFSTLRHAYLSFLYMNTCIIVHHPSLQPYFSFCLPIFKCNDLSSIYSQLVFFLLCNVLLHYSNLELYQIVLLVLQKLSLFFSDKQ